MQLIDLLLSWGVDPNVPSCGSTALGTVIYQDGSLDTVNKLLRARANPNIIAETWDHIGRALEDETALI
jgi:hypothetical protein